MRQLKDEDQESIHLGVCPHRCLNSWNTMRLGNPCLQIRIPSRTPLHLSCSSTRLESIFPACGAEQRTDSVSALMERQSVSASERQRLCRNKRPTLFSWLGMMQRTKLGWVLFSVVISLLSDSLYS